MAFLRQCLEDLRRRTHDFDGLVVLGAPEQTSHSAWPRPYARDVLGTSRGQDRSDGGTNWAVGIPTERQYRTLSD